MSGVTQKDLDQFISAARERLHAYYERNAPHQIHRGLVPRLVIEEKTLKYARVAAVIDRSEYSRPTKTAWAFIDMTSGEILRALNWKTPVRKPVGSIHQDDFGASLFGPNGLI